MKFTPEHLRAIAAIADRMQTAARRDGQRQLVYTTEVTTPEGRARMEIAVNGSDNHEVTVRFLADEERQAEEQDAPTMNPIWGLVDPPTDWELGRLQTLPPDPREEIAKSLRQLNDTAREIAKEIRATNRFTSRRARKDAK